jgi:uncharacterized membrane protein
MFTAKQAVLISGVCSFAGTLAALIAYDRKVKGWTE